MTHDTTSDSEFDREDFDLPLEQEADLNPELSPLLEPDEPDDGLETDEPDTAGWHTRSTPSKSQIRRGIEKYLKLAEAPDSRLNLLAATLGAKADPLELAVTIAASQRINLSAASQLIALRSEPNPYAAIVAAGSLSRDDAKRTWSLLVALGVVSGTLPSKDIAAASKLAGAAAELTDAHVADIEAVRSLGRK
ncbi:hypothetical protein [Rathayibacter rathayi]|uniref:hypothetical protein n=1 Tax=Rathayibacter rathayi TaxID=33887 RepID=UPI000CE8FAEC|nr:hypothetical protein [Rathayibacter rathayi]PPG15008.1 hypothetical protein C5C11_03660 [Rathayibacter rathayi]